MMDKCFIKLIKGQVTTYQIKGNKEQILKCDGEKSQNFIEEEFWEWLKRKFSYTGQEMAFLVNTDREEFKIPDDINIAKESKFPRNIDFDNRFKVITYPETEIKNNNLIKAKNKEKIVSEEGSLAEYFNKNNKIIKDVD